MAHLDFADGTILLLLPKSDLGCSFFAITFPLSDLVKSCGELSMTFLSSIGMFVVVW